MRTRQSNAGWLVFAGTLALLITIGISALPGQDFGTAVSPWIFGTLTGVCYGSAIFGAK